MASLDIITAAGTTHIELLDNPFVQKWTTHFFNMQKMYQINYRAFVHPVYNINNTNQELLKSIENLRNTITNVNTLVNNFPFDPERVTYSNIFDDQNKGQEILNEIHRYFTTAGRTINEYKEVGILHSGRWSDNFPSEFTWHASSEVEAKVAFMAALGSLDTDSIIAMLRQTGFLRSHALINDYVHELDQSILTLRKHTDYYNQIVNLQFYFNSQEEDNCQSQEGAFQNIIKEDYQYASDSEEYDVWCGNDILGKDYIEGYYDHDDPSELDITTIDGHSGKFNINVASQWYEKESTDNTIQKLIKTDEFKNWLKEYNIEYVPEMCGIPLGKVISGREFLIRKYYKSVYKQDFKIVVNN